MRVLRSRLHDQKMQEQQDERAAERRGMVGSGDRSEKIRTYNFPQNRLTDHRVQLTVHRLAEILGGDLDTVLDDVITAFEAERLKAEFQAAS